MYAQYTISTLQVLREELCETKHQHVLALVLEKQQKQVLEKQN